jgi:nucleoid DNA-binding protein
MNFKDLDKDISSKTGIAKSNVRKVLMHVEQTMRDKILFGQEIAINNVGKFELRISKKQERFNIATRQKEVQEASYRLYFKPSQNLASKLREKTVYDGSSQKE